MPWFCAHAILYARFKVGAQSSFPVWENVYLVEASTPDSALVSAEARARSDEGDSEGSFTWEGRPAEWVFVGIRKLISVSPRTSGAVLSSGDELTYSQFEVASLEAVNDLARGSPVQLRYEE